MPLVELNVFLDLSGEFLTNAEEGLQAHLYFCTMLHHPNSDQLLQVCYFYLPYLNGKPAEVITVLNCVSDTICIPMPEEDLELPAFFQRSITPAEYKKFGTKSTWRIFSSWSELETDHQKYKVSPATMVMLLDFRHDKPLQEHLAVA